MRMGGAEAGVRGQKTKSCHLVLFNYLSMKYTRQYPYEVLSGDPPTCPERGLLTIAPRVHGQLLV